MRSADRDHVGARIDGRVRQPAQVWHRMGRVAIPFVGVDRQHRDVGLLAPLPHRARSTATTSPSSAS